MSISTRVLRKYTGDNDLVRNTAEDGSDIDETPFSGGVKKKQLNANRYDLLNQQSQSESEVKEDDDENDQEARNNTNSSQSHPRESTKRKKKKKRKKTSKSSHRQSSDDVDEVERSIQEVNAILGAVDPVIQAKDNSGETNNKRKGTLHIEHKHLNPKTELKRIFGPKIIQSKQSRRTNHGRRNLKSTWLVTPEEHWPPISNLGLSMKLLEIKDGIHYFTYEHDSRYQNIQKKFFEAVESLSPENLMGVAKIALYHVDTMIQLSNIFELHDNPPKATELIERALYSLEFAFHPLFNLTKGNCRLDYRRQENRSFFIALFKHLTFVGQRACYRTALEFCKLIYSLDPDKDPLAIVLAIDFYALRSREFAWFLEFVEERDSEKNLSQLPNIAFSKAVALFQLSDPSSNAVLQDALLMFPHVLLPLLDNCGVQPDPRTQTHSYFNTASSRRIPALNLLVELYVHRSYYIWKDPDILSWLEKNTLEVLKRVDDKDPLVLDYAQKRSRRFEAKTPRAIQRHVFLSDIKKVTAVLTETENLETTFSFDPFPPLDSINLYTRTEQTPRTYESSNPLSVYFRWVMPDFQPENLPPEGYNEGDVEEAGGHFHLQDSVRNLLDAMGNLFSNLQLEANEVEAVNDTLYSSSNENDDDDDDDDDDDYGVGESPF